MIMQNQYFIGLLPFLMIIFTILILITFITWKRIHVISFIFTLSSLILSLISTILVISYTPINIFSLLQIDNYSVIYTILIIFSALSSCIFSFPVLERYKTNKEEFYILILISTLGGIILLSSVHIIPFIIGIEMISLPLIGLMGYYFNSQYSLEATIKYSILSSVAFSFIIFGMVLIYSFFGDLSFLVFQKMFMYKVYLLPILSFSMIIIGILFKLSIFPFHLWTPDVYQGSSFPVIFILSTISKISIFCSFFKIINSILNINESILIILSITAFLSIFLGNTMAITQKNIKRLLGYSSISHFGYLLIIFINTKGNNYFSLDTMGFYIINYLLSNIVVLGILNIIYHYINNDNKNIFNINYPDIKFFYQGLFWYHPFFAIGLTVSLLSLAGIPPTLGFFSKIYILLMALKEKSFIFIFIIILSSIISMYFYLKIIISLYLKPVNNNLEKRELFQPNWSYQLNKLLIYISVVLIFIFGIYPTPLIKILQITKYFY